MAAAHRTWLLSEAPRAAATRDEMVAWAHDVVGMRSEANGAFTTVVIGACGSFSRRSLSYWGIVILIGIRDKCTPLLTSAK